MVKRNDWRSPAGLGPRNRRKSFAPYQVDHGCTGDRQAAHDPLARRFPQPARPVRAFRQKAPGACKAPRLSKAAGLFSFTHPRLAKARQEFFMVKEQKRGNREAKKPKAVKTAAAPNPPLLAAGKLTPIKPPKKG
jgi:hypothetical protein